MQLLIKAGSMMTRSILIMIIDRKRQTIYSHEMRVPLLLLFLWQLVFTLLLHQTSADLNLDKQALLGFASIVPHSRRLNWNSASPMTICSSWVGVTCSPSHSPNGNGNGTRVTALRIPGIGLYGPIPPNTLGKMDALSILSLRSNRLNGSLPSDILSLPSLHHVYLQENNFSGYIPSSLSSHINLLNLSFNSFTGHIPTSIQTLAHLTHLYLQNNSLTGPIPDLNLPRLKHLNLSYNRLNGSIPSSLQKFPTSSFTGNSFLCGSPLNHCFFVTPTPTSPTYLPSSPILVPQTHRRSKKKLISTTGVIIAIAVGGSAVLFIVIVMLVLVCLKKRNSTESILKGKAFSGGRSEKPKEDFGSGVQEAEKNKLVFFEGRSYSFDLEDLLRASAEVMGKGSYGTTYKAILEEGTTVVVKRLKEVVVGKREFEQHMEIVAMVVGQHPNVVPLRAYYYSKDEKLLVYDYIPVGSLSTELHGNRESGRALDWDSRVKISLGAARGIAHIHSAGGGKLTHGNIKSSNVLLTQDLSGCISDFGLTPIMGLPTTVSSRGTGYRAPEVIETRKCTQNSDVYSFGVLLLEMLTGKVPVQSPLEQDDVVDLPRWVQSVVREEWTSEVFDVELMKYQHIEEDMVQMLQIAMACVAKVPDLRPKMHEVVSMIEEIRQSDTGNRQSSEDYKSINSPTTRTP